ncbi:MAG: AAA family ATPase [Polyangiales bacterium]
MQVTTAVFVLKRGDGARMVTLGLGEHTVDQHGRHAAKVEDALVDALREKAAALKPAQLEALEFARGTRLWTLRVELTLKGEGRKRKAAMALPLVTQPRWAGGDRRVHIAFHPLRQGDWFAWEPRTGTSLPEQAAAFFSHAWSSLPDHEVEALRLDGRPSLKIVSFSFTPRTLLDELPDRPAGLWDDLVPKAKDAQPEKRRAIQVLPRVGVDLTREAIHGDLPDPAPRSPAREQLQSLVCGGRKQSVVLIGPPGAGKTAALHRLVRDLLDADEWAAHRNADRAHAVWRVAGRRIIAGMSHLGEWEQRCVELLGELRGRKVILAAEDLHHWGRVGRSRDSDRSLAEFFRGPVARGEAVIVGECTEEQWRQLEEDAPGFAPLFSRVRVDATDRAETLRLAMSEVRALERDLGVAFRHEALATVLDLGGALDPARAFPGKAIELLRALARQHGDPRRAKVRRPALRAPVDLADARAYSIDASAVLRFLTQRTGIPRNLLRGDDALSPDHVRASLSAKVMGQPEAVGAVIDLVMRVRTGLVDPRRPYGVYLFTGPTGTGKTELARALAGYLYGGPERLFRLDMGEYGTADAASRLVGDRWTPEGLLTRQAQQQPFCVVLLDEIEKAHPRVHNLLLQLLEDGRLTDASGATASFAHTVVVMTSNLGARRESVAGFGADALASESDHLKAVREFFPPELFNRIDRVISFRPLTPEVARRVAEKELGLLLRRRGLVDRNVFVSAAPEVFDRIVSEAFRAADGARSLKRWLEDRVGTLLTEHLVAGPRADLQIARVVDTPAGFALRVAPLREAEALDARYPLEAVLTESTPLARQRLVEAAERAAALTQSELVTRLDHEIEGRLEGYREGDRAAADRLHHLDALRERVRALKPRFDALVASLDEGDDWDLVAMERFDREEQPEKDFRGSVVVTRTFDRRSLAPWGRAAPRDEVLAALAELRLLQRLTARPFEHAEHAVTVVVMRREVTDAQRERARRRVVTALDLYETLEVAYAGAWGQLESAAYLDEAGEARAATAQERESLRGSGVLLGWPDQRLASASALRVTGLGAREFFAHEAGTHLWQSMAASPELVRVRVEPGDADVDAEAALRRVLEEEKREADDLSRDALPVVRAIRWDRPFDGGRRGADAGGGLPHGAHARGHGARAGGLPVGALVGAARARGGRGVSAKPSLRVWFVTHARGLLTGTLLRKWDEFFDRPAPSAVGTSEDDVLRQLDVLLQQAVAANTDRLDRYLWRSPSSRARCAWVVHPQAVVKKRRVIGAREVPLRLTFAWCPLERGGYRVMLPRFGWWFVIEDLSIAADVLREAVSTVLLGEEARTLYEFRHEGAEWVRAWSPRSVSGADAHDDESEVDAGRFPTLRAVADELVERAARGRLGAVVGDSVEFTRAQHHFYRQPPPSILLVGPPGVGKTTFVRRLARLLLVRRRAEKHHETPRLWATSATRVIAGMIYVGMWQERCLNLVRELSHEGDWLFVDRLVPILAPQPDGSSVGEILLPAARERQIALIAECTAPELERCRRRFPSLIEAFEVIRLDEPPTYQLPVTLTHYAKRRAPELSFHPAAMRRLVQHLGNFQRDMAFPGKAMRFIDWLAADETASAQRARTLFPRDISEHFSRHSGLPLDLVADERALLPSDISARLRADVIGQDEACDVAARVIARFKAGVDDPERPIGALLFVGPTGVGKTELAKTLARFLFGHEDRMVRLDMSEYMFPGSAQRLLDAGPGVVSLAQRVREQPLSLVLLDEVEKAHPEVFDLLLGVLGEARLTDAFGTAVDFRMTLVLMTSNLGATEARPVGVGSPEAGAATDYERAVRCTSMKFFNRLDRVVSFRPLGLDDVERIVSLELSRAAARAGLQRRPRPHPRPRRARRLAELGWHPTRGAPALESACSKRGGRPRRGPARRRPDAARRDARGRR